MENTIKKVAVRMPAELHRAFKTVCASGDRDMAEVLIELVSLYVDTERAAAQQTLTYKPFRTDSDYIV